MNILLRFTMAIFVAFSVQVVHAQELSLKIGTGGTGGTYYPVGTAIAKLISKDQAPTNCSFLGGCGINGVSSEALSTGGSVQNVTDVDGGALDLGIGSAAILYFAYKGLNKFEGQPKEELRVLANLYPEDLHLVLAPGVELTSLNDLKGLRVGIDKPSSGTQIAVEAILTEFGITREAYKAFTVSSKESIQLMKKGKIDAFFYAAGTPVSSISKLSKELAITLYSFSEDEVKRANKVVPYYISSTIKSGVYEGLNEDVNTLAVSALLFTKADKPSPLVYKIVRAIWRDYGRDTLVSAHSKGEVITLDSSLNGLEGLGVPLHPGAEKYYRRMCQFTVPRSSEKYKRYPIECSG
ncbi:MAG: TAXI family TRAP transporter solute-binding subunit [Arenicella sp.]